MTPISKQRGFTLLIYLAMAIAILLILSGICLNIYEAGADHERSKWMNQAVVLRAKEAKQGNEASKKVEVQRERIRTVYQTITRDVDRIVDRPVYRNICFDDDGLRSANTALAGPRTPTGKPDKPVPGPVTLAGWNRGIGVAQADRGGSDVLRMPVETQWLGGGN